MEYQVITSIGNKYATVAMMQNDISKPFFSLLVIAINPTPKSRCLDII